MSNVINLLHAPDTRASTTPEPDQQAKLAGCLDELHVRLAELCQSLSGQLDAVEDLLADAPDAVGTQGMSEMLNLVRQSLARTDRLREQQREDLEGLRDQPDSTTRSRP